MKALVTLFKTNDSFTLLIARLTLGLVMFPHGAQKALGWFGGYGLSGTMNMFTGHMHIPALFALLAVVKVLVLVGTVFACVTSKIRHDLSRNDA